MLAGDKDSHYIMYPNDSGFLELEQRKRKQFINVMKLQK